MWADAQRDGRPAEHRLRVALLHSAFCHEAGFTVSCTICVQVLRCSILAALLYGTQGACVSQSLRRGTRNGITELSQRAPPIFGWAAITLGIGPHSSFFLFFPRLFSVVADWM